MLRALATRLTRPTTSNDYALVSGITVVVVLALAFGILQYQENRWERSLNQIEQFQDSLPD